MRSESQKLLKRKAHREISRIQELSARSYAESRQVSSWTRVDFINIWLGQGPELYKSLDWDLKGWWYFAEAAIKIDGRIFQVLRPAMRRNKHLHLLALAQINTFCSAVCKNAPKSFLEYLSEGTSRIQDSTQKLQSFALQQRWVYENIVANDLRSVRFFPMVVQQDLSFVKFVIICAKSIQYPGILFILPSFLDDLQFLRWAIREDSRTFKYLNLSLRSNKELVCEALLSGDTQALKVASDDLQQNEFIIRLAIILSKEQNDLPNDVKQNPGLIIKALSSAPVEVAFKVLNWDMGNYILNDLFRASIHTLWPTFSNENIDHNLTRQLQEIFVWLYHKPHDIYASKDQETCRDFKKSVAELLKCPICLEKLGKMPKQCTRGHLLCLSCLKQLNFFSKGRASCPICRCRGGESGGFHTSLLASSLASLLDVSA